MSGLGSYFGQVHASVTSLTSSAVLSSSLLLAPSDNRLRVSFYNHSSAALYIKFDTGASVTDFSVKVASGSYFETPTPTHTGSITGAWDATHAGGLLMITEYGE